MPGLESSSTDLHYIDDSTVQKSDAADAMNCIARNRKIATIFRNQYTRIVIIEAGMRVA
jgi:hypothetical protein